MSYIATETERNLVYEMIKVNQEKELKELEDIVDSIKSTYIHDTSFFEDEEKKPTFFDKIKKILLKLYITFFK